MKFVLSIFIFLIVLELLAFDPVFQEHLIKKHSPSENAVEKNQQVLNFFSGSAIPEMTEKEVSHMKDVKFLHNLMIIVIIILALLMPFWEIEIISLLTIFGISIISLVFPNQIFLLFHKIFFPQGNFSFPGDSFLITLYPENYFFELAYWWFFISFAILLCLFFYKRIYVSKSIGSRRDRRNV